jgi:hypothetical protein
LKLKECDFVESNILLISETDYLEACRKKQRPYARYGLFLQDSIDSSKYRYAPASVKTPYEFEAWKNEVEDEPMGPIYITKYYNLKGIFITNIKADPDFEKKYVGLMKDAIDRVNYFRTEEGNEEYLAFIKKKEVVRLTGPKCFFVSCPDTSRPSITITGPVGPSDS